MPPRDSGTPAREQAYRLPRTVVPSRYDLTIEPDLTGAAYRGTADVTVTVQEPVDEVVLNAVELEVDEAWLEGPGGRLDATPSLDADTERLTLALAGTAPPGEWLLHVAFRGVLNDKLRGFYRSRFAAAGGERVIATTQMEPTDARRAFPCWDEPDLKATFAVTLVVDDDLLAVSNGALVTTEPRSDGRTAWRFAETIPMSTYLVAFVVGPLEATEPRDADGVPLRVVHVPGKDHLAGYGLDVGEFCLRFFADWYGIPYPSDKLDLIALPDFAAGAMENLGAITFREALLLVDPEAVTRAELQRVADVVAHEVAHMWFGDLVTMRWWNGLWLNEAFATFMELLAVDAFKPDWERWVSFSLERSVAMDVDALESTRPIEYPVSSPHDAEGMFDVLTYQKGASVLRMLERYLGEPTFREGIRAYLKAREYGNAETTDLWDAIEAAAGDPVRRIMDSWILQGGYPLVGVERTADGVRLTQERFRFAGTDDGSRWAVPVMVRSGDDDHRCLLEGDTIDVDLGGSAGPVVVNAGGHGFYRVRYSSELLEEVTAIVHSALSPIERYLLVDDTWAAVLAGRTPATAFLDLAAGFEPETDRTVWAALLQGLGQLDAVLDDDARPRLQAFVRRLVGPAAERLGWDTAPGDDELTRQLRGTLLAGLGVLGDDPDVQARAREALDRHRAEPAAVDPNVAAAAIAIVAHAGGDDEYERFLETFRTSPSPQEQLRYLYVLAGFQPAGLVERTLALTLSDDVRTQNAPFLLQGLLAQRAAGPLAWAFVKREWDAIVLAVPGQHDLPLPGRDHGAVDARAGGRRRGVPRRPPRAAGRQADRPAPGAAEGQRRFAGAGVVGRGPAPSVSGGQEARSEPGHGVPLAVVDAFTGAAFAGNPAGVCVLAEPADEGWMQSVAAEMKHAETAFVVPKGDRWGLRWFTPTVEIELCGHATLASAHVLWESGVAAAGVPLRFDTLSGELGARSDGDLIELDFPASPATPKTPPDGLGAALGGVDAVATATNGRAWLVELATADEVRRLRPDFGTVAQLVETLAIVTAPGDGEHDVVSRVFAPNVGIDEDPVTGAAHCIVGPWWAEKLGRGVLRCHQASARGGDLRVTVDGDRVRLAGRAVTVLRGELVV